MRSGYLFPDRLLGVQPWACSVPQVKVTDPQNISQRFFSFQSLKLSLGAQVFEVVATFQPRALGSTPKDSCTHNASVYCHVSCWDTG